jgi:arylformamidase
LTVWRGLDQAALDAQYNAAATVPSLDVYLERYASESARFRAANACVTGLRYGPGEREVLDVFPARDAGAPVFIYMHGGYWRRLSKDDFSFVAGPFVRAGIAVVVPSYALAPQATLDEITREMREAFTWVHANIAGYRGDPSKVVAGGHSAGGQLAGMLAATEWTARGLPANAVRGVCGISGLYDLEPVRRSYVNEWLRLDEASARRNSPFVHMPPVPTQLLALVGSKETGEFRRQTLDFAAAWRANRSPAEAIVVDGFHHYDIVLELLDPDSGVSRSATSFVESATTG